jgi:hypothetical protein
MGPRDMATVYLVAPELVNKTNSLLARVQRRRQAQESIQDWLDRMETLESLLSRTTTEDCSRREE